MSIIQRLRAELRHNAGAGNLHRERMQIERQFFATNPDDVLGRAALARLMVVNLRGQAYHHEESWLARTTSFLPSPAEMRAQANHWQSDPEGMYADFVAERATCEPC